MQAIVDLVHCWNWETFIGSCWKSLCQQDALLTDCIVETERPSSAIARKVSISRTPLLTERRIVEPGWPSSAVFRKVCIIRTHCWIIALLKLADLRRQLLEKSLSAGCHSWLPDPLLSEVFLRKRRCCALPGDYVWRISLITRASKKPYKKQPLYCIRLTETQSSPNLLKLGLTITDLTSFRCFGSK